MATQLPSDFQTKALECQTHLRRRPIWVGLLLALAASGTVGATPGTPAIEPVPVFRMAEVRLKFEAARAHMGNG